MKKSWVIQPYFLKIIVSKLYQYWYVSSRFLLYYKISFNLFLILGWLFWCYGISTFAGYLIPNPLLYKYSVLLQTIQFSMSTQFNCQKHFNVQANPLSQTVLIQTIQFSISIVFAHPQSNVKTVLFQIIQFSISRISISKTVLFQTIQFNNSV